MVTLKNSLGILIAVSLLLPITIFFFGPLEILMSQSREFWFDVGDVLPLILGCTVGSFVILFLICCGLSVFGRFVQKIVLGVLAAIGIAFYLQGNWSFVSYGKMDGSSIDWSGYGTYAIINTVLWCVIVAVIIFLFVFRYKWKKIYVTVIYCVIGMELLSLGMLKITGSGAETKTEYAFTNDGALHLSKDKNNILVIVADGFDGEDFLPVLSEEPDFLECFDGFTFYEDTCGTSLYSEESGITLLTGNQMEVGYSFGENVDRAFSNTVLYDVLDDYRYESYIYVREEERVSEKIADQIANYSPEGHEINDYSATFEKIYKMVAFRYMPHVLKDNFWYSFLDFLELKGSKACVWYNTEFYQILKTQGIVLDESEKNIYQFYWIQGPHEPATMDRYCEPLVETIKMADESYSDYQFEQTIGVVRLFTELIREMKIAGVYDNTTIIFTADHGWDNRANPLLLIKPANQRGELKISSVPVSMIEDYLPTLLYYITGNKTHGDTIYELEEGQKRTRMFYLYGAEGSEKIYTSRIIQYYAEGALARKYTLGSVLLPDQILAHSVLGLGRSEGTHIWSVGNETVLEFDLQGSYGDLIIEMEYLTYAGEQKVTVYANDHCVADYYSTGTEQRKMVIPREYIESEEKLRIRFELPNAVAPADIDGNSRDERLLALGFLNFAIYSADEN